MNVQLFSNNILAINFYEFPGVHECKQSINKSMEANFKKKREKTASDVGLEVSLKKFSNFIKKLFPCISLWFLWGTQKKNNERNLNLRRLFCRLENFLIWLYVFQDKSLEWQKYKIYGIIWPGFLVQPRIQHDFFSKLNSSSFFHNFFMSLQVSTNKNKDNAGEESQKKNTKHFYAFLVLLTIKISRNLPPAWQLFSP